MARVPVFSSLLFALLLLHEMPMPAVGAERARVVRPAIPVDPGRVAASSPAIPDPGVQSAQVIRPRVNVVYPKAAQPLVLSSQDTLVQVAQLYPTAWRAMAFGDTDHDGRNEAVFYWQGPSFDWHYVILEEQGNNVYSQEYVGADLIPWAIGDLDQDGKSELIGEFSYYVQVYESVGATTYPTQLVWSSPALTNVEGFTTVADTDRDGRMEIIHSVNTGSGSYLYIFENSDDNTYAQVFATYTGTDDAGEKVVADLDGDGLTEIAFCGTHGWLQVFESPADNTWIQTCRESTGLRNAYATEGGMDTDGNGDPELFVAGEGDTDFRKKTLVYESIGDNRFARVATLLTNEFTVGGAANALGDLNGTGKPAYVNGTRDHLWFYTATGIGQWELYLQLANPGQYAGIQIFDVNRNGKSELFWDSYDYPALVLENPPRTSDVGPGSRRLQRLILSPNPFVDVATLVAPNATPFADRLSVYDVAGRLVERLRLLGGQESHVWDAGRLSAGVYYVTIEGPGGTPLARGRATVVR
jgi:hypothetical protein